MKKPKKREVLIWSVEGYFAGEGEPWWHRGTIETSFFFYRSSAVEHLEKMRTQFPTDKWRVVKYVRKAKP